MRTWWLSLDYVIGLYDEENENMIQCSNDECGEWFHTICMNLVDSNLNNDDDWHCSKCCNKNCWFVRSNTTTGAALWLNIYICESLSVVDLWDSLRLRFCQCWGICVQCKEVRIKNK